MAEKYPTYLCFGRMSKLLQFFFINPIAHGPFIPWLPRGGAESTPPAKITLRSVRFQFFYTCIESYIQLAKIKEKCKKISKTPQEIKFLKKIISQKFVHMSKP